MDFDDSKVFWYNFFIKNTNFKSYDFVYSILTKSLLF